MFSHVILTMLIFYRKANDETGMKINTYVKKDAIQASEFSGNDLYL